MREAVACTFEFDVSFNVENEMHKNAIGNLKPLELMFLCTEQESQRDFSTTCIEFWSVLSFKQTRIPSGEWMGNEVKFIKMLTFLSRISIKTSPTHFHYSPSCDQLQIEEEKSFLLQVEFDAYGDCLKLEMMGGIELILVFDI